MDEACTKHFTLKMEAARFPKTLVSYCNTTLNHITEAPNLNLHHDENLNLISK
jgi:hypothetical protein